MTNDSLLVNSRPSFDNSGQRQVIEILDGIECASYVPDAARYRGAELFRGAAIAKACASMAQRLFTRHGQTKGFGAMKNPKELTKLTEVINNAVSVLLADTEGFSPGIEIRLKFNFKKTETKSFVRLTWGNSTELDLDPDEASHHAYALFSVAESTQTDIYLADFLTRQGVTQGDIQELMKDFFEFRQKAYLENILGKLS